MSLIDAFSENIDWSIHNIYNEITLTQGWRIVVRADYGG
jgi:hypothetical protein